MAVLKGKLGNIKKNAVAVSYVNEWTLDVKLETEDVTDFGDSWKAISGLIASWTGKMSAFFDPSNTEQKAIHDALITATPTGALTDVTFYISATNYYSGSVIVTGVSIETMVSGHVKVTFTFEGNGALSYN